MVDLDLSLSPDIFGLRAFDDKLPLARMLPGSNPCELRLLLPDSKICMDGFHDVVIENLSASFTWRSSHVMPADVTALRQRGPKAEGRFQDNAEATEGSGILRDLQRGYRVGPGCAHDGIPSGIGSIMALPGGVVRRVERLRE